MKKGIYGMIGTASSSSSPTDQGTFTPTSNIKLAGMNALPSCKGDHEDIQAIQY
jgi:hypothetical protein